MVRANRSVIWLARLGVAVALLGLYLGAHTLTPTLTSAQSQYNLYFPVLLLARPIVFESDRDGNYYHDLYLMQADGSGVVRLNGPESAQCPMWSPDGRTIVYSSLLRGDIFMIGADGSNLTQLTSGPRFEDSPAWSPNQQYIVFSVSDGLAGGISALKPGQPGETNLISSSFHSFWNPRWTSDGQHLAFSSNLEGNTEIYVVNVLATEQRIRLAGPVTRLTFDVHWDSSPDWSPDGSRIVFQSDRDGDPEIWVMRSDGSEQMQLTHNRVGDSNPVWSPDGTRILYTSERDGGVDVFLMNADGSETINLTNSPYWEGCASWLR